MNYTDDVEITKQLATLWFDVDKLIFDDDGNIARITNAGHEVNFKPLERWDDLMMIATQLEFDASTYLAAITGNDPLRDVALCCIATIKST